jgi:hypothetical protein
LKIFDFFKIKKDNKQHVTPSVFLQIMGRAGRKETGNVIITGNFNLYRSCKLMKGEVKEIEASGIKILDLLKVIDKDANYLEKVLSCPRFPNKEPIVDYIGVLNVLGLVNNKLERTILGEIATSFTMLDEPNNILLASLLPHLLQFIKELRPENDTNLDPIQLEKVTTLNPTQSIVSFLVFNF